METIYNCFCGIISLIRETLPALEIMIAVALGFYLRGMVK